VDKSDQDGSMGWITLAMSDRREKACALATDKALKLASEYYHSTFATKPTAMKPIGSLLSMVKLPIALEFFHHHLTNVLGVALKPRTFNHLMSHYFAR
jgi:hypothetical protein